MSSISSSESGSGARFLLYPGVAASGLTGGPRPAPRLLMAPRGLGLSALSAFPFFLPVSARAMARFACLISRRAVPVRGIATSTLTNVPTQSILTTKNDFT